MKFVATGKQYNADEIGVLQTRHAACQELSAGNVGYIISGIKTSREVKVGDTITRNTPCDAAIDGFSRSEADGLCRVYPIETEDFENLRSSLENFSSMMPR